MTQTTLHEFLERLRTELGPGATGGIGGSGAWRRATVEVAFRATEREGDGLVFRPILESSRPDGETESVHRVTLEWSGCVPSGPDSPVGATASVPFRSREGGEVPSPDAESERGLGGDPGTLRRRLEFVLGGPPGFNRGAQAGILADLLREFGRGTLLESLQRDWISQFDTGPEASLSVTRDPGGSR